MHNYFIKDAYLRNILFFYIISEIHCQGKDVWLIIFVGNLDQTKSQSYATQWLLVENTEGLLLEVQLYFTND